MEWHNGHHYWLVNCKEHEKQALASPPKIRCGRFFCKIIEDAACCASCPRFIICDKACMNEPERCGLVHIN